MKCPKCQHESEYKVVWCPSCGTTYDAERLEKLAHLEYVRERLRAWRVDAAITVTDFRRLVAEVDHELAELRLELLPGAAEPAASPTQPSAAPAAPPAPEVVAPAAPPPPAPPPTPAVAARPAPMPEAKPEPAWRTPEPPAVAPRPRPSPTLASQAPAAAATINLPAKEQAAARPVAKPPRAPLWAPPKVAIKSPLPPDFSWRKVGTYLLSTVTLNVLLGLTAFLFLFACVMISVFNVAGLEPWPHLFSTLATTLLLYAAGYVVRQRLKVLLPGTVLLAIGGAFIPLDIYTLGHERLLNWQPATIWLLASALGLATYAVSHRFLRDWPFAILTATAGGSALLSALRWLALPLEWGLCGLSLLAIGYVLLARRLRPAWPQLAGALHWSAQAAPPALVLGLMAGKFLPAQWQAAAGAAELNEYAVGGVWWVGCAFYALCARLSGKRPYAFAAAWLLPFAYLFTLTKAPWPADWYNLCLALLAPAYLAFGRWRQRLLAGEAAPPLRLLLAQPAYQVGLALTVAAAAWLWQSANSRVPTLYVVCLTFVLAARLFRSSPFRFLAAYLLPVAIGFSVERATALGWLGLPPAWQNLICALLAIAYLVATRLSLRPERLGQGRPSPGDLLGEPVPQVALLLSVAAAFWPFQDLDSRAATLYALAGGYALAARLLRLRECRYVAAYLLPLAVYFSLQKLDLLGYAWFAAPWHNLSLAALGLAYLLVGRFLLRAGIFAGQPSALRGLVAEPVYQVAALLTVVAVAWPYQVLESRVDTLWLVAATYTAGYLLFRLPALRYASAYLVPFAVYFSLQELGLLGYAWFAPAWHNLALAVLALAYIVFGRFVLRSVTSRGLPETAAGVLGEPLYQVALLLTVLAVAWPFQTAESRLPTLWLVTAIYALGAYVWRLPLLRYVTAYLLPTAFLVTLQWLNLLEHPWFVPAWQNFAFAALALAYLLFGRFVLRTGVRGEPAETRTAVIGEPVYQVGVWLTLVALLWPYQNADSRAATLWLVAATYALAYYLFRLWVLRYPAAYLVPVAVGFSLPQSELLGLAWATYAWHNLAFAGLALLYVLVGRFLLRSAVRGEVPHVGLALVRDPVYQMALWLTAVAVAWPFQTAGSRLPTLWVVAATYALATYLWRLRWLRYVAAYLLPFAVYFGLERLAWEGLDWAQTRWWGLAFALLALAYLLCGRFVLRARAGDGPSGSYRAVAAEPLYQVAGLLTVLATLWPQQTIHSLPLSLATVSVVHGLAAFFLRQRAWAYVAVYLLPPAGAFLGQALVLDAGATRAAWAGLAVVLLAVAEVAVRRSGEARRPLLATTVGLGSWRSRFASPLFAAGYAVSLLALGLCLADYWQQPAAAGVRLIGVGTVAALLVIVAAYALSAWARRTSLFLYPATWLFLLAFVPATDLALTPYGINLAEPDWARLLAGLGLVYLVVAFATDRAGGHYAKPVYLVGYFLSAATMFPSVLAREVNAQVVGLWVLIYGATAWQVHVGRHPSHVWLVKRLFADADSLAHRTARALFLYLAAWLFPVWLALALSLWRPPLAVAHYGLALALLAPLYVALGLLVRRSRGEYRQPWYIAGYALSAIGLLLTSPEPWARAAALAIAIVLYAASSAIFRRSGWLYLVALLAPLLQAQVWELLGWDAGYLGLGLVVLALMYGVVGLLLHSWGERQWSPRISGPVRAYALPFFAVGYVCAAVGMGLAGTQERYLATGTFALGTVYYLISALLFRQYLYGYLVAGTAAITYVVGLTALFPAPGFFGLILAQGLALAFAIAELLRRGVDGRGIHPGEPSPWGGLDLSSWATPFYILVYAGTIAIPLCPAKDGRLSVIVWCLVAAIYWGSTASFRHPLWLYPTVAASLGVYLATAHALVPGLSPVWAMATLALPTWLLWLASWALSPRARPFALARHSAIALSAGEGSAWALPPLLWGWALLAASTLGSLAEPRAGLVVATAYAALLASFVFVWQGKAELWGSVAFASLAFEQALRLLEIPPTAQPPFWAVAALALTVLAFAARRGRPAVLALWYRPFYLVSLVVAPAAMLGAIAIHLFASDRPAWSLIGQYGTLQALAGTIAVCGPILVAHGFDRKERLLSYLGVGLAEVGYVLELLFFGYEEPQYYVIPGAAYLFAVAYFEWRRGARGNVKQVLESLAVASLLLASFAQAAGFLGPTYSRNLYGTVLLVQCGVFLALGAALCWKKTFFGAVAMTLADAVLLALDPWGSLDVWFKIALASMLLFGILTFLYWKRQQMQTWLDSQRQEMEAWD